MSLKTLLEVNNLTAEFSFHGGSKKAIDNVSFVLHQGKTIGIVGESGSGKSVTSLSTMRLISKPSGKITNGQILFHHNGASVDFAQLSDKEMEFYRGNEIAMVFQEPMTAMNPVMTCGEQVMESILLHQKDLTNQSKTEILFEKLLLFFLNAIKLFFNIIFLGKIYFFNDKVISKRVTEAKLRAVQLFKKVKLPRPVDLLSSYPHEISGGQKQRMMIAMALSCNPSILIADEPTTALDATVQKTLIELFKELQEEFNMGIIFVSHDLGIIAELADEVLVMYNGKIVEQGSVRDIYLNPKHPYTRGLLACRPPNDFKLRALPTRKHFMEIDEDGLMCDTNVSVVEVINKLKITDQEVALRNKILYQQDPLFEINNLKKYFPLTQDFYGRTISWVKAVDDISFKVFPGETLGIVGESGCGKTTLGRTLLKLIDPSSGQIIFNGSDITNLSSKGMRLLRKDIQIIFQDPYGSLNPKLFIGEAIMEPMIVHKVGKNNIQRKREVLELMLKVGLKEEDFYRYPHEFSGGQRQRICIARALALHPKFILCDESVSALDVSVQAEVLNLLNELRDQFGLTYIFISHDLSVVKFMSDRIIVMNQGKIAEEGFANDIYLNPKSIHTQNLIESIPKGVV